MKDDGTSINCVFRVDQSLKIKTSTGKVTLKLNDIVWLAGKERKRIRLLGKAQLLSGQVERQELQLSNAGHPFSINLDDIIFIFNGDIDLENKEALLIEEYDNGQLRQTTIDRKDKSKRFKVTLLPETWEGNIKLSSPFYPNNISQQADFEVNLFISGDETLKPYALKLALRFKAYLEEKMPGVGTLKGDIIDTHYFDLIGTTLIPDSHTESKNISVNLNKPFKNKRHIEDPYLYISYIHESEQMGSGNLLIERTCSNVLRLTLDVTNDYIMKNNSNDLFKLKTF